MPTDLAQLIALLRANGVTRYSTPELTLELLPQLEESTQGAKQGCEVPQRPALSPSIERALERLPANYRDPSLWSLGDRA